MKPLLVGQGVTNARRLPHLIGVDNMTEFQDYFDLHNILVTPAREAGAGVVSEVKAAALKELAQVLHGNGWNRRPIVLAGTPVAELIGIRGQDTIPYYTALARNSVGVPLYVMPDPCSNKTYWDDPAHREAASEFLKRLGRLLVR